MSHYFFDIHGEEPDQLGVYCDSLAKAKCEAVELAGQVLCEESDAFWEKKQWGMTVTNSDRLPLFTVSFLATETAAIHSPVEPSKHPWPARTGSRRDACRPVFS